MKKIWKYETSGNDGNTLLFNVNIFNYKWLNTGNKAEVIDPLYNKKYLFSIYDVIINGNKYTFAAGEFSNSIFGFFI